MIELFQSIIVDNKYNELQGQKVELFYTQLPHERFDHRRFVNLTVLVVTNTPSLDYLNPILFSFLVYRRQSEVS